MKYKKYPSYKDSGVEWLGEIPTEWEMWKVFHAFNSVGSGTTPTSNNESYYNGHIPWITTGELRENKISSTKKMLTTKALVENSSLKLFPKGSIAIAMYGATIGRLGKLDIDATTNQACCVITNSKVISNEYLYYWLMGNKNEIINLAYGGGQPNISQDTILNLKISAPILDEQEQITKFLDNATQKMDTLIQKQENLIKLLKEKRQAVISHAVTKGINGENSHWKKYRLDWINTIVRGNTGFKKDELLENGEYVALQYGKTYKVDEVNETFKFYINNEFYKFNQVVNYGDTILISTSETIEDLGHSCFYNRNDLGLIGGEQILLKPNTKLVFEKYLYYSSKIFSTKLKKYATGLKVFRFNIDDLKEIFISIPSIEEQQEIANYLDDKTKKIDKLIKKATKSIKLLKEKRTALISAAVTGKIDVRELV